MRSGSGWLRQSAEELALKKGDAVMAVVKATEVMDPEGMTLDLVLFAVTTVTYFADCGFKIRHSRESGNPESLVHIINF